MKRKIYKITGVVLALLLVFSVMGAFVPANEAEAQAYNPNKWNTLDTPSPGGLILQAGSTITDFVVAADGKTIYLADGVLGQVVKSTTGGHNFSVLALPVLFVGMPGSIAVAPDDPNTVAVVEVAAGADVVWISTNGGATWSSMGAPGAAAEVITDIAVSPARTGTLLGREYAVTTANPAAGNFGNVYLMGATAAWAAFPIVTALGYDFTSLAMGPNWTGERVVLAVGSGGAATAGGNPEIGAAATGDSFLVAINTATGNLSGPGQVRLDAAGSDSPAEMAGAVADGEITSSSLALPADFDSTSVTAFRAYAAWTSSIALGGIILCADDVYRVDFNTVRKLEVRPAVGIHSISYFGTVSSGTLMAGESANNSVWYSSDPMVAMPTWGFSFKPPTGAGNVVMALTSAKNAFAGAAGADSAFSLSVDGGLSFSGIAYIDEVIADINDVMPSPDGSTVFMATDDGVNHSLWRGVGFPDPGSWERVRFLLNPAPIGPQFTGPSSLIRLSPEYASDSTVYWFDYDPAGAAAGTDVQRSTDGGQIWANRTAPVPIMDATIETADIVYVIDGAGGNVYKSTNGGWFFGLPTNAAIGPLYDVEMAPSYPAKPKAGNVLIGSTAAVGGAALSLDSADSFIPLLSFIPGGGNIQIMGDEGYATNNIIYAGNGAGGIWRYVFGSSAAWEQISPGAPTMSGLAEHGGVLYGIWSTGGAAPSGAERTLLPTVPDYAAAFFDTMNIGAAGAVINATPNALRVSGTATETVLWAINTATPALMAYEDTMAKAKPEVTVPELVPFDSVGGGNTEFIISWHNISNALFWEVEIYTDSAMTQRVVTSGAAYMPALPPAPTYVVNPAVLVGGKNYWVQVRVRDQMPGDAIRSQWSKAVKFTVEAGERVEVSYLGVEPLGPQPGATGVPVKGPGFTWSPYAESTKYEFQLATDAEMTNTLASANVSSTAYKYDGTLDYKTTYFWRVRGIEPTVTGWSPVASFTTEAAPPAPAPVPEPTPVPEPIVTPTIIWAIIGIGAILVIAVVVLIVRTRVSR